MPTLDTGARQFPDAPGSPSHMLPPIKVFAFNLHMAGVYANRWAKSFPHRYKLPIEVSSLKKRGPNGEIACVIPPTVGDFHYRIYLHERYFELHWTQQAALLAHELAHLWNVNPHLKTNTLSHNAYHRFAESRILALHNLRLYYEGDEPLLIKTTGNRILHVY